jgi:hypothetical protein
MITNSKHSTWLGPATGVLLMLCVCFGWWQSGAGRTGGPMSPAKVLWLFLAITHFYLVPFWLWRDRSLSPGWRRVWGVFFMGFMVRAVIELPLLLLTRIWRCEHGIAHDGLMLGALALLSLKIPSGERHDIRHFAWLAGLALLFEALNAWMFGQMGNPEAGIYFASSDARFRTINLITWAEILVLFPLLVHWLIRYFRASR